VAVCFLSFLIGTRFAAEPLRDAYAAAAEDALARFGDECALGVRALPAMGPAGLALLRRAVAGDFSERTTLSAVCEAAAAFARETDAAWRTDVLARALRPFRDAILYVKGVSEEDDIARPLVRNFADWAAAALPGAPLELVGRVLECTLVYLQQCFRAPAFFAPMLELFARIGVAIPEAVIAGPDVFFPQFAFLFAREFDANGGEWEPIVATVAEFNRALLAVDGDAWMAAFRGVVAMLGGGEEIADAFREAIGGGGQIDTTAVRVVLNALRFTRDRTLWG
jgi:hypothetical protein